MGLKIQIDNRGRVPSAVLKGFVQEYKSVYHVFLSTLVRAYLRQLHQSYLERSHLDAAPDMRSFEKGYSPRQGRADDQGNTWKQLRPATYRIKEAMQEDGTKDAFKKDYVNPRLKSPNKSTQERIKMVESYIDSTDFSGDGINIRSGRLLAACFPPFLGANGQLYPGPDQKIEYTGLLFKFETTVLAESGEPLDKALAKLGRPIEPNEGTLHAWLQIAIEEALQAAEEEFHRVDQMYGFKAGKKTRGVLKKVKYR